MGGVGHNKRNSGPKVQDGWGGGVWEGYSSMGEWRSSTLMVVGSNPTILESQTKPSQTKPSQTKYKDNNINKAKERLAWGVVLFLKE